MRIVLILLLTVLLISCCIQQPQSQPQPQIQTENTTNKKENLINLNLTIAFPSGSVNVNETFIGQYIVENKGEPFKAFIVTTCRREGYEKECLSKSIKDPIPGKTDWNRDYKQVLEPCTIDEKGIECVQSSFKSSGKYIYEIMVYNCSQIENTLGINCELNSDYNKIKAEIRPLGTFNRTVIVK